MPNLFTITLIVFCAGTFSCTKKIDAGNALLRKINALHIYDDAIARCHAGSTDSILLCAEAVIDIDTIKYIDRTIWREYGKARALFHNNLGLEAIKVIDEILPRTEGEDLLFEKAELLQLRSSITINTYRMQPAAEDLYKAAEIYWQLKLTRKASSCYVSIANLQYNVGNYSLAVENGRRVVDLLQHDLPMGHEDSIQLMQVCNTVGLGYYKLNKIDSAQRFYDRSHLIAVLLKEEFWQALVAGNTADIYAARGMITEAISNWRKDVATSLKYHEPTSAALSLLSIGEVYVSAGQLEAGRQKYDSAHALLSLSGRPISLSRYYHLMSQWFELKHDEKNAFKYYKRHIVLRDSVQNVKINSKLQELQSQTRFEKQRSDITLLRKENELKEKQLTITRISVVGFLLVSALLGGLLHYIRRTNRKLNQLNHGLENKVKARTARLRKINKELDTYLYRASHDVRRPILSILGLAQLGARTSEDERIEIFGAIKKTANEMDKMLKKLQMAYELEKEAKDKREPLNINAYVKHQAAELRRDYPSMNFEIVEHAQVIVNGNVNLLNIVLMNILENACIFSIGHNDHVTISVRSEKGVAYIVVKDRGVGIDPAFIQKVFDPYVRCSNKSTGSGLGLYLAMKAAKLMGGDISATSTVNEGSAFIVSIPENAKVNHQVSS